MKILVTGSAGHLGEALMRTLRAEGVAVVGIDRLPSPWTDRVGDIADPAFVREAMAGVGQVLHTATLHKPHVETHARQAFIDTNVTGTLNLLEAAAACGVTGFVFTSTTSAFGAALRPPAGAPAVWVDETLTPVVRNIYGLTKTAAEDLCELMHQLTRLPVIVLRTSRFFPEDDDDPAARERRSRDNLQANELLYRRVDIEDVVEAHRVALREAGRIGFGRYIVSATTPFTREDCAALGRDAAAVLRQRVPGWQAVYARQGWTPPDTLDRVYDNRAAREALGWQPRVDFAAALARLDATGDLRSPLARVIGQKGYHRRA
ncbi:NAD-dependent epimerase/dehydratase family protein [Leptothrix discophora]|uniref:NAD(P)-dependent oxidoreductase n=1 Tax=Leptothrix discophora TaxID=89 RepID=A0ABT9G2X3_LEPDI|nr:NAD(P)-dependent oxidoreductase [Leptothrix discophora]MDP4300834.1 NAD(P)-dependent oxidoreductase [Leptothrix discophora]